MTHTRSLEYSLEDLKYFAEVERLVAERYSPLADEAKITGRKFTSELVLSGVQRGVHVELYELAELSQAMPHPRSLGALTMPEIEEPSHA